MPIFAGMIASTIGWFITYFGVQISTRAAITLGVLAVGTAAYLATKAAIFAIVAALGLVIPPAILTGIGYALPTNLPTCIAAIFLSDAIFEAYGFWQGKFQTVAMAMLKL